MDPSAFSRSSLSEKPACTLLRLQILIASTAGKLFSYNSLHEAVEQRKQSVEELEYHPREELFVENFMKTRHFSGLLALAFAFSAQIADAEKDTITTEASQPAPWAATDLGAIITFPAHCTGHETGLRENPQCTRVCTNEDSVICTGSSWEHCSDEITGPSHCRLEQWDNGCEVICEDDDSDIITCTKDVPCEIVVFTPGATR